MGRRNEHSAAEFDQLVFSQIEQFLAQHHANQLSLRKIANLINYAPSTLVAVYGSYAELLLRVNARTLEALNQYLDQLATQHSDPLAQIHAMASGYFQFASQNRHPWQLIFDLSMPGNTPLPPWIQKRIDHAFWLLSRSLSQLCPDKSTEQCQIAGRVLWSSVHGITVLSLGDKLFLNQLQGDLSGEQLNDEQLSGEQLIDSLLSHYLCQWQATANTEATTALATRTTPR